MIFSLSQQTVTPAGSKGSKRPPNLSQPMRKQGKVVDPDLRPIIRPISIEAKHYGYFVETTASRIRGHHETDRVRSWWSVIVQLPRTSRPNYRPSESLSSPVG